MRSSERDDGGGAGAGTGTADRGFVTAEAAVTIPTMAIFAMALVWALMAASAQIQCVDAARAGARAAARSDPHAAAVAAARSAAPAGAEIALWRTGELWRVRVSVAMPGPGPLGMTLSAEATALAEDTVGTEAVGAEARPGAEARGGVS